MIKNWLKSDYGRFLLKAVCFYIIWYILYDLWLLPDGRLDQWVNVHIVAFAGDILRGMHFSVKYTGRQIGMQNTAGILLVSGCSGVSASGLFAGFVIAYPGRWGRRLWFIIVGVAVIFIANILRIVVLVLTQKYYPDLFNFTHHYSTTVVFYLVIFGLWMIWVGFDNDESHRTFPIKFKSGV